MWSVKADKTLDLEALWAEYVSYLDDKDPLYLETLKGWHKDMVAVAFDAYEIPQDNNRLELDLVCGSDEHSKPHFWLHGPVGCTDGLADFSLSSLADAMEAAEWDGDSVISMEEVIHELRRMIAVLERLVAEAKAEDSPD